MKRSLGLAVLPALAVGAVVLAGAHASPKAALPHANTPIEHVVVIFDENVSYDHYFATYPNAANSTAGEPEFHGSAPDKSADGLSGALLTANPNGVNPQRLPRTSALTCDQNHTYTAEQVAVNNGNMNRFVLPGGTGGSCTDPHGQDIVMDYFDGNTVTGLWNLAQHFSMGSHFYGSGYGPSTPGAIELVSGQTHGVTNAAAGVNGTMTGDPDPELDDCGGGLTTSMAVANKNIGDLMNAGGVTWGWFQGGFRPSSVDGAGHATCAASHKNIGNATVNDYSAHHEPFMYYASTTNRHHTAPQNVDEIGHGGQANHQYDLTDFDAALSAGKLPQVSFLKAAAFEDGHAGYSDPIDEQHWIARVVDAIEASPDWAHTAIFIAYDDSDGWYDHSPPPLENTSQTALDAYSGPAQCGVGNPADGYQDRCGLGPRLPLLAISPYARVNHIDDTVTEQASLTRFIEDNWSLGRIGDHSFDARAASLDGLFDYGNGGSTPAFYIDPATGEQTSGPGGSVQPTPTPNSTATPVPTVRPTPTPAPVITAKPFKLKCSASGRGRKLTVSCAGSGTGATTVKTTLKLTVTRSGKTVVTGKGTLKKGKLKLVLKPKHSLRKGKYTVRIAVTRSHKTSNIRLTFKVK